MDIYELIKTFRKKYKGTIGHRWKKHCDIINMHLNPSETVTYAFIGQKNFKYYHIFETCVVAITNKRILIGQKRVLFGYHLYSITPDLYNDLTVYEGLFWGKVIIDTVKEVVTISNLDKKSLLEIETAISEFMMKEKKKYKERDK